MMGYPSTRGLATIWRVLAELLIMWRRDPIYPDIAYEARQISTEAQLWPSNDA